MQRSFKSRLEALERLEVAAHERPRWLRSYLLPTECYERVLVGAFRSGDLCIEHGRITADTNPNRMGWRCHWIADVLNAFDGWGDIFLDQAEIAAARELLSLGWLAYMVLRPPDARRTGWHTTLSHAASYELYMTDQARYYAAHATGRQVDTAARIAAWRLGSPIETLEPLHAWLATARPFVLSPAIVEAIGPIAASGLVASSLGYDPDALVEEPDAEEF